MAPNIPHQPSRSGGLSLYANLLDPVSEKYSSSSSISRPPVVFKQHGDGEVEPDRAATEKQQQISAASLRFQPTKRPHLAGQKTKSKTSLQKPPLSAPPIAAKSHNQPNTTSQAPPKTTLADWTAEGEGSDVNGFYEAEKRQRGGRKKRKKTKEESHVLQNWDDIYDPTRPNSYEDYKNSDERIMEVREWKDRLYAHRRERSPESDSGGSSNHHDPVLNKNFAPPGTSFAPPSTFDNTDEDGQKSEAPDIPRQLNGESTHASGNQLSDFSNDDQMSTLSFGIPEPPVTSSASFPPPTQKLSLGERQKTPPLSISRAPVRYKLPEAPSEIPASETELKSALQLDEIEDRLPSSPTPRSLRPGQKGFAERLMSKYGWSKGTGLGVSGSGIVNPLRVQVEKQKKRPDSEGGGFVAPGGRGKIIGGTKKGRPTGENEEGRFGPMSEVVVLYGIVDGMDLDAELEGSSQGGLMQEIGEECGEKYGRVERVFIDRSHDTKVPVFVRFTSQLSALRAVNALEGRIFNGNTIVAKFFDAENFESGVYDA